MPNTISWEKFLDWRQHVKSFAYAKIARVATCWWCDSEFCDYRYSIRSVVYFYLNRDFVSEVSHDEEIETDLVFTEFEKPHFSFFGKNDLSGRHLQNCKRKNNLNACGCLEAVSFDPDSFVDRFGGDRDDKRIAKKDTKPNKKPLEWQTFLRRYPISSKIAKDSTSWWCGDRVRDDRYTIVCVVFLYLNRAFDPKLSSVVREPQPPVWKAVDDEKRPIRVFDPSAYVARIFSGRCYRSVEKDYFEDGDFMNGDEVLDKEVSCDICLSTNIDLLESECCAGAYCLECIHSWLCGYRSRTCPVCRREVNVEKKKYFCKTMKCGKNIILSSDDSETDSGFESDGELYSE